MPLIQRALITAGGRATRLRPITHTLNKHLIPLANTPMILHVIEKVLEAGIREIVINVNPGERELQQCVGDGSRWGVTVRYVEQEGGPLGLAHIIRNAEPYLGRHPFLFFLGDNLVLGSLRPLMEKFEREELDACFAFVQVPDARRFGVPEFRDGQLVRIIEKPEHPPSNLAQAGIYLYRPVIFDAVAAIPPSARGEYEISDANTYLLTHGAKVGWLEMTGWWKDTGKPEDLLEGNQLLLSLMPAPASNVPEGVIIGPEVRIQGRVAIGPGTTIDGRVLIRGPVAIGAGCTIRQSYIGPYTAIGDAVTITNTELEHSIVFDHARIDAGARIVDSIIGRHAVVTPADATLPHGHKLIIGDHAAIEI